MESYKNKKILIANTPAFLYNNQRHYILSGSRWAFSSFKYPYPTHDKHYQPYPFPLAWAYSLLENLGYEVYSFDPCALNMNEWAFKAYCLNLKPDIIIMDIPTIVINQTLRLIREVKETLTKTEFWVGGIHITAFPNKELYPEIDKLLPHEIEVSLLKELNHNVPNFEDYPLPNRTEFPNELYSNFEFKIPSAQIMTSRGCTNSCSFCVERHIIYGNNLVRHRKIENVIEEIKYCKDLGAKQIYFDDMDFTIDEDYTKNLCLAMIESDSFPYTCLGSSKASESMIAWLSDSDCLGLAFGVETINPKAQKFAKKITQREIKDFTKLLKNYGISSVATFTLGLPNESEETLKKNIEFATQECNADSIQFSIATPFPGTPFYKYLNNNRLIIKGITWDKFDGANFCTYDYPNLSHEKIEELFHWAMDLRKSQNMGFRK